MAEIYGLDVDVVHVQLSADEVQNRARFGCSVAEQVVAAYEVCSAVRALGAQPLAELHDVGLVEPERVGQLVGALIDAGCSTVRMLGAGGRDDKDRAHLVGTLVAARIDLGRVRFQ